MPIGVEINAALALKRAFDAEAIAAAAAAVANQKDVIYIDIFKHAGPFYSNGLFAGSSFLIRSCQSRGGGVSRRLMH